MIKLKLVKNNKKNIYKLKLTKVKKTTKFNTLLNFGTYISNSNIKIYKFLYFKIISYFKLGSNLSKQFSLISLYYLKNFLNKNLK